MPGDKNAEEGHLIPHHADWTLDYSGRLYYLFLITSDEGLSTWLYLVKNEAAGTSYLHMPGIVRTCHPLQLRLLLLMNRSEVAKWSKEQGAGE